MKTFREKQIHVVRKQNENGNIRLNHTKLSELDYYFLTSKTSSSMWINLIHAYPMNKQEPYFAGTF